MSDLVNAICGIDCKPRQDTCNGYCVGKADHPPLIQRQDVMTPECSNADEWLLFITEHSPEFVAVQIAERLDEITALRARLEAVEKERDAWEERAAVAVRGRKAAEAALATARRDALLEVANMKPTREQIANAAMGYDHSFGLMTPAEQENLMHRAGWWLNAWQHVIRALANEAET